MRKRALVVQALAFLLSMAVFVATPACRPGESASSQAAASRAASQPTTEAAVKPDTSSPPFTGRSIPKPPATSKPWRAPKQSLPEAFISATVALFDEGLADPRECQYSQIEVGTGSCWSGDGGVVKTHGWVLPGRQGQEQAFAVCWNGLVYPVVSVGESADLAADVLATVKADEEVRAQYRREQGPASPFCRMRNAVPEAQAISHAHLQPLQACLLLRLGEGELAQKVWTAWTEGMNPNVNDDAVHMRDPYLMLATDWAWSLFDRAVCAHMRGDDRLALLSAEAMAPIGDAVEQTAAQRKFTKSNEDEKYLDFLSPLGQLLADQRRRARETAGLSDGGSPATAPAAAQSAQQRIRDKIRHLEDVAARQWGQPGGISLGMDGIVQQLIQEGDPAVEPLIECLEKDQRLTRSVHFWRDFARYRSLIGVHEAAYAAVAGILKTSFFGAASTGDDLSGRGLEGRQAVAAQVRGYWKRFKGVPLEERWFLILADDDRSPSQWAEAAGNIARPANVQSVAGTMFGGNLTVESPPKPGEPPRLGGEALRAKKSPSVSELMTRRMEQVIAKAVLAQGQPQGIRDRRQLYVVGDARDIAKALHAWDMAAALPAMRTLFETLLKAHAMQDSLEMQAYLARELAELTDALAADGDKDVLGEYSRWIVGQSPKACDNDLARVVQPLWRHRDDPDIAKAADTLLNGDGSPWNPLLGQGKNDGSLSSYHTSRLLETPLIGMPALGKQAGRALADKSAAGEITVKSRENIAIAMEGWSTSTSATKDDSLCPADGTKAAFRICDAYAYLLSRNAGFPQCELYWPQERRDKAVTACTEFLRQYGQCYLPFNDSEVFPDRARFSLAPLDHPATAGDVKEGKAIFSLDGQGQVRTWALPRTPMKATRKGAEDYGFIWQAEEVLQDGHWRRFYGFVGRYGLYKVPAEEINVEAEN